MSLHPAATTPQYRQFTRQHYLASSEREGGLVHLWHMERLAEVRLTDEEHLVNTQEQKEQEAARYAVAADRRHRELTAKEQTLYEENQILLKHLLSASDDKERKARKLRLYTPADEPGSDVAVMQACVADQLRYRSRVKQQREREVVRQNERLLKHLIEVKPQTTTAKQLDDWYNTVHKKRLKQLSRFKKAEPFAGARILEEECGVRLGRAATATSRRRVRSAKGCGRPASGGAAAAAVVVAAEEEKEKEKERYTRRPLVAGQPHPMPPVGEVLTTTRVPKALLPALQSTSYGGYLFHHEHQNQSDENNDNNTGGNRHNGFVVAPAAMQRRPEWQSIAATDMPLIHYAADKALAEPSPVVTAAEESPCTHWWRCELRSRRGRAVRQRLRERVDCSAMARASLTPREAALLSTTTATTTTAFHRSSRIATGESGPSAPPPPPPRSLSSASLSSASASAAALSASASSHRRIDRETGPGPSRNASNPPTALNDCPVGTGAAAGVWEQWQRAPADGPFVAL